MSSPQETSKEAVPCKSELKSKAKSVGVSAPSSPRTPSPAASLLTISSVTATEKSGKGSDEASFSGACLPESRTCVLAAVRVSAPHVTVALGSSLASSIMPGKRLVLAAQHEDMHCDMTASSNT